MSDLTKEELLEVIEKIKCTTADDKNYSDNEWEAIERIEKLIEQSGEPTEVDEMDAMAMYMIIATEKDHEKGREKFLSWLKQLLAQKQKEEQCKEVR